MTCCNICGILLQQTPSIRPKLSIRPGSLLLRLVHLLFGFDGVDSTGQLHKAPTTNARVSPSTLDDVTGNEADYYDNLYALRGRFTVASVSFVVCGWYRDTPGMCAVSIMGSYLQ